jgi:hypothetical protein
MTDQSYYDILGVDEDATQEEIKEAFRSRAMECHPDQASDMSQKEAKRKFIRVREAFDVLGDGQKREKYDRNRSESASKTRSRQAYEGDWNNFTDEPESTLRNILDIVARGAVDSAKHGISLFGGMLKWAFSYGLVLAVPAAIIIGAAAPEAPDGVTPILSIIFGVPAGMLAAVFIYLGKFAYTGET